MAEKLTKANAIIISRCNHIDILFVHSFDYSWMFEPFESCFLSYMGCYVKKTHVGSNDTGVQVI